jgi:hypothetical protein
MQKNQDENDDDYEANRCRLNEIAIELQNRSESLMQLKRMQKDQLLKSV